MKLLMFREGGERRLGVVRDGASGGRAQTSGQTTLTALPATWSPGTDYPNSPMSAYVVHLQ